MIYFQHSLPSFLPRLLGDIHCEDALVVPSEGTHEASGASIHDADGVVQLAQ